MEVVWDMAVEIVLIRVFWPLVVDARGVGGWVVGVWEVKVWTLEAWVWAVAAGVW